MAGMMGAPPGRDRGGALLLGRGNNFSRLPRAKPCSHTTDLLSARSPTMEPQMSEPTGRDPQLA